MMEKRAFKRIPVESSNIAFIGHSYPRRMLEVGFNNGSVYRYKGVNNKTYHELLDARSKGRAFNELIRNKYPYKQTVNKNGEKITGGYKKVAMRDFDEFIKTAGIFRTYADALTGKNVARAQDRYTRAANQFERASQISDRMEKNRAGAERALRNAKRAYNSNSNAIKSSLNKTRDYRDASRRIKEQAAEKFGDSMSIRNKAGVAAKNIGNNIGQIKQEFTRSKLLKDRTKLGGAVNNAKGALNNATDKVNRAADLVNKKYSDVLNAQRGISKARIGSVAAKGATAAGIIGTAMIGKKLYNKYKDSQSAKQYNQQPEYASPQYGAAQNGMM